MSEAFMKQLKQELEEYVTGLFQHHTASYLVYHNLFHTREVVKHALEIGAHYQVSGQDDFILFAAAWFHDTGHLFTGPEEHEEESIKIANRFLDTFTGIPGEVIVAIGDCIRSTRMPQKPLSLLAEILCDADLYHLGTADFKYMDALVKQETLLREGNASHWNRRSLQMLQTHKYHTAYCRTRLDKGKADNIASLSS